MRSLPIIASVAFALSACAYHSGYGPDRYGAYGYDGRDYAGFEGGGDDVLDPWLAETEEGRTIVATGFSVTADGRLDAETANRANIWFRRYADTDDDLRLTDEEIRLALVQASRDHSWF